LSVIPQLERAVNGKATAPRVRSGSVRAACRALLLAVLLLAVRLPALAAGGVATDVAQPPPATGAAPAAPVSGSGAEQLEEIVVVAPEPRFVAPTRRDRIGRIWAPVEINGRGPFRLVLDTGATRSAITAGVAARLGLPLRQNGHTLLRGVTGSATVATVAVDTLAVGELLLEPRTMPIVPDALGGAEGVLGTEGLFDKRIVIDFRNDNIAIRRSHREPAPPGFVTIPVEFIRGHLMVVAARIGGVSVKAIIDTGGQATIGNLALRDELLRWRSRSRPVSDEITGATDDVQSAERYSMPAIVMGGVEVRRGALSFGDMVIFEYWKLTDEPAMLVGMDVLGVLDTLIIDYPRRELQVRVHGS
jgi:predicted aspartyl protease